MIAAATDTTAVALEWAMAELIRNPRVMAKVQDEVARVAGYDAEQPAVAEAELSGMGYLKAVVKEVFRLHPPLPLLLPRESMSAAAVQGGRYEIPARTALLVNAWAIGRDPAAWDAPEEFRPERFVGGGAPADFRGTEYQLIPFGAGRRICAGLSWGLRMVTLMTAALVHALDWHLADGMTADKLDMEEAYGLTLQRAVPLMVRPKPRLLPSAYALE